MSVYSYDVFHCFGEAAVLTHSSIFHCYCCKRYTKKKLRADRLIR